MNNQSDQVPSYSASVVLTEIAEYYCQDIHAVKEQPPYFYFKDEHSQNPAISPIDYHWLECLCSLTSFDVVIEYITGYSAFVRPRLINDVVGSISLLQHYELLLCQLFDRLHTIAGFPLSASDSDQLWQQLKVLSNDVFALTSAPRVSLTPYIRANIAIPTLQRIQHHLLNIFIFEDGPYHAPLDLQSLAGCVVSLLISSNRRLDPSFIAPMLTDESQFNLEDICVVPPNSRVTSSVSQLFTLQSIDWSSVSIDDNRWSDHIVGVQTRSAQVVWMDIEALLAKRYNILASKDVVALKEDKLQRQQYVIQSLGMGTLSAEIRSKFFAKNEEPFEPSEKLITSTYVMLGKRKTKTRMIELEKPHRTTPARAYVALVFCLYLSVEEDCKQVVSNLLPVYLELVDSPDNVFSCLGVSALHLLLKFADKEKLLLEHEEHCLAALDSAYSTHRNGLALILVGQTQSCLFKNFQRATHRRKQITRQWLLRLRQLALGAGNECSAGDLLVGGIIPLLFQHAKLPNADAIELGRLGLSAMLPLFVSETTEKKTFARLFVAMINLMAGAYPIMAHHKDKIMGHLLAATTKLKICDDSKGCSVFALGLHTAALANFIVSSGGRNNTETLLDTIERESGKYQDVLLQVSKEVREYSSDLELRLTRDRHEGL